MFNVNKSRIYCRPRNTHTLFEIQVKSCEWSVGQSHNRGNISTVDISITVITQIVE